ncbi:MAG TPA: tetratricopeptide repeat protein, partial [Candidatus Eisenbacteria bacterium]|nr:tetratricopeptide repeat protein [Candidatus Eisenbacteria bacterium]
FDSNQWDRAVASYQRALEQAPGNADVRVDMAVALHNLGQNQKAKDEMERVTRESPAHRNAWLNLGVVSAQLGDRAGAIKAWEQYLKLDPNGPHSASIRAQIEDLKRGS